MTDLINVLPLYDLPEFSAQDINSSGLPKNWGYAVGGNGVLNDQPHIYHVMDGGDEWEFVIDVYLLPFCVDKLMKASNVEGYRAAQRDMRRVMGV